MWSKVGNSTSGTADRSASTNSDRLIGSATLDAMRNSERGLYRLDLITVQRTALGEVAFKAVPEAGQYQVQLPGGLEVYLHLFEDELGIRMVSLAAVHNPLSELIERNVADR